MQELLMMMKLFKGGSDPYEKSAAGLLIFASALAMKDSDKEGLDDLFANVMTSVSLSLSSLKSNPNKTIELLEASKNSITDIQNYLKGKPQKTK